MIKIILFLLSAPILGQGWVPDQMPGVTKEVYRANIGLLKRIKSYNDVRDQFDAWNINSCYKNLNAPPDTVLKFMKLALFHYGHSICWNSLEKDTSRRLGFYKKYYGVKYIDTYNYFCFTCDSLKKTYNVSVRNLLQKLYFEDQKDRNEDFNLEGKVSSQQIQERRKEIYLHDSFHMVIVDSIIKIYNYPGNSIVGQQMSYYAFFIIQHAPKETMEKYYSYIRDAVDKGELDKYFLPFIEDRIAWLNGKKQKFGTQYKIIGKKVYLFPIENGKKVDELRKNYGLLPLKKEIRNIERELNAREVANH